MCTVVVLVLYIRILFHLGTSKAPMVGSSPVCSVHVPTGLKLIFRCRESGLASLLQGSCSSMAVTRWESDMVGNWCSSSYNMPNALPFKWRLWLQSRRALWTVAEE